MASNIFGGEQQDPRTFVGGAGVAADTSTGDALSSLARRIPQATRGGAGRGVAGVAEAKIQLLKLEEGVDLAIQQEDALTSAEEELGVDENVEEVRLSAQLQRERTKLERANRQGILNTGVLRSYLRKIQTEALSQHPESAVAINKVFADFNPEPQSAVAQPLQRGPLVIENKATIILDNLGMPKTPDNMRYGKQLVRRMAAAGQKDLSGISEADAMFSVRNTIGDVTTSLFRGNVMSTKAGPMSMENILKQQGAFTAEQKQEFNNAANAQREGAKAEVRRAVAERRMDSLHLDAALVAIDTEYDSVITMVNDEQLDFANVLTEYNEARKQLVLGRASSVIPILNDILSKTGGSINLDSLKTLTALTTRSRTDPKYAASVAQLAGIDGALADNIVREIAKVLTDSMSGIVPQGRERFHAFFLNSQLQLAPTVDKELASAVVQSWRPPIVTGESVLNRLVVPDTGARRKVELVVENANPAELSVIRGKVQAAALQTIRQHQKFPGVDIQFNPVTQRFVHVPGEAELQVVLIDVPVEAASNVDAAEIVAGYNKLYEAATNDVYKQHKIVSSTPEQIILFAENAGEIPKEKTKDK